MTHLVTTQCSSFLSTSFISFSLLIVGKYMPWDILSFALTNSIIDILVISKIIPSGCGSAAISYFSHITYPIPGNFNIRDN